MEPEVIITGVESKKAYVLTNKAGNSDTVKISNFYVTTNPTWFILFINGVVVIAFGINLQTDVKYNYTV